MHSVGIWPSFAFRGGGWCDEGSEAKGAKTLGEPSIQSISGRPGVMHQAAILIEPT